MERSQRDRWSVTWGEWDKVKDCRAGWSAAIPNGFLSQAWLRRNAMSHAPKYTKCYGTWDRKRHRVRFLILLWSNQNFFPWNCFESRVSNSRPVCQGLVILCDRRKFDLIFASVENSRNDKQLQGQLCNTGMGNWQPKATFWVHQWFIFNPPKMGGGGDIRIINLYGGPPNTQISALAKICFSVLNYDMAQFKISVTSAF